MPRNLKKSSIIPDCEGSTESMDVELVSHDFSSPKKRELEAMLIVSIVPRS